MGSVKLEQSQKVENDQERGREITERGSEKLEEAEVSRNAIDQIEIVDDDDKAAVDTAMTTSEGIAKSIAESEIKEPGREVGESLKETSEESTEYGETETEGADKASEMVGDFSDVGGNLASELQQRAQEFQEIASQSDQVHDQLESEYEQISAALEGVF